MERTNGNGILNKPKAYSYLRFSTPEQQKGDSFRRQTELAERYAKLNGLDLDNKLTFQDLGVSAYHGSNLETGKLGEFREAVISGLVQSDSYLLVESLDRISRTKARQALRILEDLCDMGITVVTLNDGKQYTKDNLDNDPMSLIMSILIFIRAHEESDTKAKRLKEVWKKKRSNMKDTPLTGRVPAWLTLDKSNNTFKVNKSKASVVRMIFDLADKGMGQNLIAQTLNNKRVPVFGKGKHWHRSYVVKLLNSPSVIGLFVPHTETHDGTKKIRIPLEPVPDYYPAIVDKDVFERVTQRNPNPLRGKNAGKELRNIFGGMAHCPLCGSTMQMVNKGKRSKRYLVCSKAKAGAGCKYRSVVYEDLERRFIEDFHQIQYEVPSDDNLTNDLLVLDSSIYETERGLKTLLDLAQNGGGDKSKAILQRISEVESSLDEMIEKRNELIEAREVSTGRLVSITLDKLYDELKLEPLDRNGINALLRIIFKSVVVNYLTGNLELHWKHGGISEVVFGWNVNYL